MGCLFPKVKDRSPDTSMPMNSTRIVCHNGTVEVLLVITRCFTSTQGFRANHPFEYFSAMVYAASEPCYGPAEQPKRHVRNKRATARGATSIYTTV